jgi:hypothetical protein
MIGTILSWYGLFTLGCIVGIVVGGWCASLKHADLTNEIARLNRMRSWRHGREDLEMAARGTH